MSSIMEQGSQTFPVAQHHNRDRVYSLYAVALIFAVPALGGFNFGFDIGATSYAIVQMQSPVLSGVSWFHTVLSSPILRGTILSSGSAGALIGSSLAFAIGDKIGRRRELQLGSLLYLLGALLEVWTAQSSSWGAVLGITVLILGRVVYGIGIGISMHAAPTYIAEMGPSSIRGLLVSLKEASIVLGILTGYMIGYACSKHTGGWAWIYASSTMFSMLMLILSTRIPRSCRWLMLNNMEDEALESLQFVFTEEQAQVEFSNMKQSHEEACALLSDEEEEKTVWHRSYRAPLVAGVGLVVLQQITGQPSVLSYATPIFRDAGLSDSAPVLLALFKLLATLSAAVTVEKYGRKMLLYTGCSLMLIGLTILSFSLDGGTYIAKVAVLVAMFVYIGGYQVGFGPITWLLTSELYPLSIRGQAVAIAVQMNFLLNTAVQFGVPLLQEVIGLSFTFTIFGILTAYR
jgi:sugar porter (SP) family MFS transporter